jgi:uncharacterized protein (TIGR02186 family)
MYLKLFIAKLFIILFISSSNAAPIISGISTNKININTDFDGAQILLFGAKAFSGDVVVSVRGPKKNYFLTKKSQFLGIWYNGVKVNLQDIYSYYSLHSTYNSSKLDQQLLSDLELGKNNINFNFKEDHVSQNDKSNFKIFFLNELEKQNLYDMGANKVDFLDETLFKVMLKFPESISRGVYSVDIYLIDDGSLISFQTIPIYVKHNGLSAKIFDFAYDNSLFYALIAIFIALFTGWFVNLCFVKFFDK